MKINTLKQFKSYAGRYYDRFETSGLTVAGAIGQLDERIRNARARFASGDIRLCRGCSLPRRSAWAFRSWLRTFAKTNTTHWQQSSFWL